MKTIHIVGHLALSCSRAAVTGALCGLLVAQPLFAELVPVETSASKSVEISGRDRVLHALNRLTFGPRAGDIAQVQAMGLNQWIERQLNPATIDDSALEARLAEYPAMNMTIGELQQRYPGPQMIRAIVEGKAQLPNDPLQRAMVADQTAFYKIQQKLKAANAQKSDADPVPPMGSVAQGDMTQTSPLTGKGKAAQVQAGMNALDAEASAMASDKPLSANDVAFDQIAPAPGPVDRGAVREQAQQLVALAPLERMKAIMALTPNQLVKLRASLGPANAPRLLDGLAPQQKEMIAALQGSLRMVALETAESRITRDIYSERQLEAVMTDFWLNHFNVYIRKNQNEPFLIPTYERDTIRPHALGRFEDLLVATAKSPAMLVYLDNFRSVGPDSTQAQRLKRAETLRPNGKLQQVGAGLNENYGRELMELHTLGVNGGYTQADVTQVAKVFTGWGIDRPYQGAEYRFENRRHQPGTKTVLGRIIPENGENEGLEVLHILATSPATANFISRKLAVRFVSDTPPDALVDRMAESFLKSSGDIKSVLRTMFNSPEFWSADAFRAKVKTPEEFVLSAVRASDAQISNLLSLVAALDRLGMPLYGMQTPNGYSWTQDGWVSTGALVNRMNFALILSGGRLPGVRTDWSRLLGEPASTVMPAASTPLSPASLAVKERQLEQILLGTSVSEKTRATVLNQSGNAAVTEQALTQFDLGATGGRKGSYLPRAAGNLNAIYPTPDDPQADVMAGLLLGSPEFQRR
jgi:uncharacterized protein (DUF1800 family)